MSAPEPSTTARPNAAGWSRRSSARREEPEEPEVGDPKRTEWPDLLRRYAAHVATLR